MPPRRHGHATARGAVAASGNRTVRMRERRRPRRATTAVAAATQRGDPGRAHGQSNAGATGAARLPQRGPLPFAVLALLSMTLREPSLAVRPRRGVAPALLEVGCSRNQVRLLQTPARPRHAHSAARRFPANSSARRGTARSTLQPLATQRHAPPPPPPPPPAARRPPPAARCRGRLGGTQAAPGTALGAWAAGAAAERGWPRRRGTRPAARRLPRRLPPAACRWHALADLSFARRADGLRCLDVSALRPVHHGRGGPDVRGGAGRGGHNQHAGGPDRELQQGARAGEGAAGVASRSAEAQGEPHHLPPGRRRDVPNIILANRLQTSAVVTPAICAACDHNRPQNKCKRDKEWIWRGDYFPADRQAIAMIRNLLESEMITFTNFDGDEERKLLGHPEATAGDAAQDERQGVLTAGAEAAEGHDGDREGGHHLPVYLGVGQRSVDGQRPRLRCSSRRRDQSHVSKPAAEHPDRRKRRDHELCAGRRISSKRRRRHAHLRARRAARRGAILLNSHRVTVRTR